MKIALLTVPQATADETLLISTQEAFTVTLDGSAEARWEQGYVWFLLQMQGARGNAGPFTADDLQRIGLAQWQPGEPSPPTISQLEYGMRRLQVLEVARLTET